MTKFKTKLATRFVAENAATGSPEQIAMIATAIDQGRMSIGNARLTAAMVSDWQDATLADLAGEGGPLAPDAAAKAEAAAADTVLNRMAAMHGGKVVKDHDGPRIDIDFAPQESFLAKRMRLTRH